MVVVGNYRNRAELRKKPRRQFHYTARILTDKDTPPIACSIADISESGARLALERDEELPETFILLLTANGGARRHCRVIWRDGLTIGVEFPDHRLVSAGSKRLAPTLILPYLRRRKLQLSAGNSRRVERGWALPMRIRDDIDRPRGGAACARALPLPAVSPLALLGLAACRACRLRIE